MSIPRNQNRVLRETMKEFKLNDREKREIRKIYKQHLKEEHGVEMDFGDILYEVLDMSERSENVKRLKGQLNPTNIRLKGMGMRVSGNTIHIRPYSKSQKKLSPEELDDLDFQAAACLQVLQDEMREKNKIPYVSGINARKNHIVNTLRTGIPFSEWKAKNPARHQFLKSQPVNFEEYMNISRKNKQRIDEYRRQYITYGTDKEGVYENMVFPAEAIKKTQGK